MPGADAGALTCTPSTDSALGVRAPTGGPISVTLEFPRIATTHLRGMARWIPAPAMTGASRRTGNYCTHLRARVRGRGVSSKFSRWIIGLDSESNRYGGGRGGENLRSNAHEERGGAETGASGIMFRVPEYRKTNRRGEDQ